MKKLFLSNGTHGSAGAIFTHSKYPSKLFLSSCWHVVPGTRTANSVRIFVKDNQSSSKQCIGSFDRSTLKPKGGVDFSLIKLNSLGETIYTSSTCLSKTATQACYVGQQLYMLTQDGRSIMAIVRKIAAKGAGLRFPAFLEIISDDQPRKGDSGNIWTDALTHIPIAYNSRFHTQSNFVVAGRLHSTLQLFSEQIKLLT